MTERYYINRCETTVKRNEKLSFLLVLQLIDLQVVGFRLLDFRIYGVLSFEKLLAVLHVSFTSDLIKSKV